MGNLGLGVAYEILAVTSLAIGAGVFLVLVPTYYWLRHTPHEKQRIRWGRRIQLASLSTLVLPSCLCVWMANIQSSYWDNQGWDEYWRAPLVYPYEIRTETPVPETFCIARWQETCLIKNVSGYVQSKGLVIGVIGSQESWFLLRVNTGDVEYYSVRSRLQTAATEEGAELPAQFEPSAQLIRSYWDRPKP